jgi:fatty-acyl-CoA synthase
VSAVHTEPPGWRIRERVPPGNQTECAPAVFDEHGALANFDAAVGELVDTYGGGGFTGYYNDPGATDQRMRHGMYWSGDLAYRDADGWIYLAGRTARRLDAGGCRVRRPR